MCCLVAVLALLGPRALAVVWWLVDPVRWGTAFSNGFIAILGVVFLPWTTNAWVLVQSNGLTALDLVALAIAIFLDFASYGGGAYRRKDLGWNY